MSSSGKAPTWLASHLTLRTHYKTENASEALGIKRAHLIGHLHCLWYQMAEHFLDDDLSTLSNRQTAKMAEWEGDPDEFIQALVEVGWSKAGFLDVDEHGKVLGAHDWDEHTKEWRSNVAKRESDKAYQQEKRKKDNSHDIAEDRLDSEATNDGRGTDIDSTNGGRGTDINPTSHDVDSMSHDVDSTSTRRRTTSRPTEQNRTRQNRRGNLRFHQEGRPTLTLPPRTTIPRSGRS